MRALTAPETAPPAAPAATAAQPWRMRLARLGEARAAIVLGLAALVAVTLVLRTLYDGTTFWIDEGLSVGIADRPVTEIPAVLRLDGSPPLYYVLLHFWLGVAGRGEEATHALSLLFAALAVPAAWWALRPFGARAAWTAAVLATVNPFLTAYAQETRMYTLVVLLGLLALGAFLRAFVLVPSLRSGVAFGLLMALLLYTHNWALFFAAGCGLAWLGSIAASRDESRSRLLRAGVAGFGVAVLLYLPWLPTLLFQAAHTGAPWALAPGPDAMAAVFGRLLGREGQLVLLLAAGTGLAVVLRRGAAAAAAGGLRWALPARAAPVPPARVERRAVLALGAIFVATVVLAWLSSQLAPAWALRYLAVCVAPLLLLSAIGLARAGRLGLAGLGVVAVLWTIDGPPTDKSNVSEVAGWLEPALRPGDLVLSTQPEQIPVLDYYLDGDVRWATLWGPVADSGVTDWRDGVQRLAATSAERDFERLIDSLPAGARLALVQPIFEDRRQWSAPWTELVRLRSREWRRYARDHPGLALAARYPPTSYPDRPNPVAADVFVRTPVG